MTERDADLPQPVTTTDQLLRAQVVATRDLVDELRSKRAGKPAPEGQVALREPARRAGSAGSRGR